MSRASAATVEVALLTAGRDRPYAFGISTALIEENVHLDVITGEDFDFEAVRRSPLVKLYAIRREPAPEAGLIEKGIGVLQYYARLIRYAWDARPTVFHILWNNKFETFDRVGLMLYYKALGKRVVLTAHNTNAGARDSSDSVLNRLTLRIQYHLSDHIFVHTDKMKEELVGGFGVPPASVSVIPFGINNSVPATELGSAEARARLGLAPEHKVLLFFGNIAPYKGLEYLVEAFQRVVRRDHSCRLIVAGRPKQGAEAYWNRIQTMLGPEPERDGILLRTSFIPDDETEVYFKAADALVLPYTNISQSGVLVLGLNFGLPVLAADVGSLRAEVEEGQTGLVFAPESAEALEAAIERYFQSDVFRELPERRAAIRQHAHARYSWTAVARTTLGVYDDILRARRGGVAQAGKV
jgi:glycosyltransferase involved in cell wall biosynthesis